MAFETYFTDDDFNFFDRPHAVLSAPRLRMSGAPTSMPSEPHPGPGLTPASMSSPFAVRLGTNYCPTDQEVLEIHSLLVEPTLRLKSLDDEIADLQKSIDKLVEERVGLESYVKAHTALISPVRRLPLDIIQEIFIACMPTHRNCVMSAIEAPILLGRICSAWRAIALSAPRLWASLHIVEPVPPRIRSDLYEHKVVQRLEIIKTWLDRSGQCPLSISLLGAPDNGFVATATAQFIQALIPFAPRWQHIHFTIPPSLILEVMSNIDTDIPWLESVTFRCERIPDSQSITCGSFEMLKGARISSFSMLGGLCALERLPVQWNQLTTLTIDGPESPGCTTEMVLPVIFRCSQLRFCKLLLHDEMFVQETMVVHEHPIVELRFLHSLAIRCSSSVTPTISMLLNRLSSPELRNFALLGSMRENSDYRSLARFFARSLRLESFEICDNTFSTPSFHETLRALMPTIQRLWIRRIITRGWQELGDETLRILATPGLCPSLRHLIIDRGSNISEDAILRFVTARMLEFGAPTLQRVEIHFDREMAVDIMPSLQPFLETGLAVSLDYPLPWTPQSSPWEGLEDNPDDSFWARRPINYW